MKTSVIFVLLGQLALADAGSSSTSCTTTKVFTLTNTFSTSLSRPTGSMTGTYPTRSRGTGASSLASRSVSIEGSASSGAAGKQSSNASGSVSANSFGTVSGGTSRSADDDCIDNEFTSNSETEGSGNVTVTQIQTVRRCPGTMARVLPVLKTITHCVPITMTGARITPTLSMSKAMTATWNNGAAASGSWGISGGINRTAGTAMTTPPLPSGASAMEGGNHWRWTLVNDNYIVSSGVTMSASSTNASTSTSTISTNDDDVDDAEDDADTA